MNPNWTPGLNLTAHRSGTSVWDRRGWDGTRDRPALSRWLIGVGGGALTLQGLRRRSLTGSVLAGVGAGLAWWALSGRDNLPAPGRWFTCFIDRAGHARDDVIHAASADSFPASDAPAWTPTVGTGLRRW
jgi:hypothetical protein